MPKTDQKLSRETKRTVVFGIITGLTFALWVFSTLSSLDTSDRCINSSQAPYHYTSVSNEGSRTFPVKIVCNYSVDGQAPVTATLTGEAVLLNTWLFVSTIGALAIVGFSAWYLLLDKDKRLEYKDKANSQLKRKPDNSLPRPGFDDHG